MRDILSRITKWWEAGEAFGLATVTRTYRSAPRDPGAALAVAASGGHEVVGSVSGGCVEGAVYELSLEVCSTGVPVAQSYGVSDDDAFAVGLTCGGIIELFVERVDQASFPELGEISAAVDARRAGGGRDPDRRTGPAGRAPRDLGRQRRGHQRRRRLAFRRVRHARVGPAGRRGRRRRARHAGPGTDRRPAVRRGRRAARRRAQRVRELVRPAAPDAGVRRDRLRRRRGPGREVPRLPRHRVRRPPGVRHGLALPRRRPGRGRLAAPLPGRRRRGRQDRDLRPHPRPEVRRAPARGGAAHPGRVHRRHGQPRAPTRTGWPGCANSA